MRAATHEERLRQAAEARRPVGPLPLELASMDRPALLRAADQAKSAIDAAYWTFTRSKSANTRPPPPELYARQQWVHEALRRERAGQ